VRVQVQLAVAAPLIAAEHVAVATVEVGALRAAVLDGIDQQLGAVVDGVALDIGTRRAAAVELPQPLQSIQESTRQAGFDGR
jgi:hypothetical protein